ncbi:MULTISPECIES: head-tail connector protein [unclassified Bradyrhizobium]
MNLITLAQANDHLRLDLETDGNSPEEFSEDPRTPEVERKIAEATDAVLNYIDGYIQREKPTWDEDTVPPGIRAAILLTLAWLWEHRGDGETDQAPADGYLTKPATALLHRYRDPALA